jgi:glycine cleavage system regulatory protein
MIPAEPTPATRMTISAPHQLILIAHGGDRPGILDEVSQFLFDRGANILESKLLSMRGTFILAILLSVDDAPGAALIREGLPQLSLQTRIQLDLRDAATETGAHAPGGDARYRFRASGRDQAGILNKLSHLLRVLNVNIEDVHTHLDGVGGALPGGSATAHFDLELMLAVPRDTPVVKLREYLGTLCHDLSIRWEMNPA